MDWPEYEESPPVAKQSKITNPKSKIPNVRWFISIRYFLSHKRQSLICIAGVTISVTMFIAMTAMMHVLTDKFIIETVESSGHITIKDEPRETRTLILEKVYTNPDALLVTAGVKPRETVKKIQNAAGLLATLDRLPGVVSVAPVVNGSAIATYGTKTLSLNIFGVEPERQVRVTTIGENVIKGSFSRLRTTADGIVLGRGVADVLGADPGIEVVGEAKNAAEALARAPALRPDVAILDVRLPDGDGVSVCRELRSTMPDLTVIMLTSYSDDEALFEAIMAGASGYLLKQILGQDLVSAVRTVAAGGSLLDPTATTAVLERMRRAAEPAGPLAQLSEQERTVLELIGEGLTNRQIGERMFLAEKTVKNYVSHLLAKLGLERRTQAAVLATQVRGGTARPD